MSAIDRPALSPDQEQAVSRLLQWKRAEADARDQLAVARQGRDQAVKAALDSGLRPEYVAHALSISRQRVEQLAERAG